MQDQPAVEELNLSKTGINIKSFQMNTLLTFVGVMFSGACAAGLWFHMGDTKDASAAFVQAIREQTTALKDGTQVAREQNCLMRFDQKERQERAEFCRSIAR
jgi:hypothetical protein